MTDDPIRALEKRETEGGRLFSPSAARNKAVIADTFEELGLTTGRVLEIGSGTGEHAVEILSRFEGLNWTASDIDTTALNSCRAWAEYCGFDDQMAVRPLDLSRPGWQEGLGLFDAVYSANVIHISPPIVFQELVLSASDLLEETGVLALYGPFRRNGTFAADSNAEFDKSLRSRNEAWGVRDLEQDIVPLAQSAGMTLERVLDMPANNNFVLFRR